MSATGAHVPDGAQVMEASGKRGTGNVLLCIPAKGDEPQRVIKQYRVRRSPFREALRSFSQRWLEGKRGASARARFETERASIKAWREAGCDVVEYEERPLPEGVAMPATWLRFYAAPLLGEQLRNPNVDVDQKVALVARLAASMSDRHEKAQRTQQPLLVHEHGNINHYFVEEDQLIAFDLENGFRDDFPIMEAIAQEIASTVRSIIRAQPEHTHTLLNAFTEHYSNRELLRQAVEHALYGGGLAQALKRWHDVSTRPGQSKLAAMRSLLDTLK